MLDENIYAEYKNAVDNDVRDFVNNVISGNDMINYITVAFLSGEASDRIEELTRKHVEGNRVVLDTNAIKHIINRHGKDGLHDNSMSDTDDIARIGYIIMNYDNISYDGNTTTGFLDENGEPSPTITISKRIDGTFYVIEAVNSSKRRKNYIITAYISKA